MSVDAAFALETFQQDLVNVPEEVAHYLEEMKTKDVKIVTLRRRIQHHDNQIQKHIRAHGSLSENPKEAANSTKIISDYEQAMKLQEEKCELAHKLNDLIIRHVRKLDCEIKKLQNEGALAAGTEPIVLSSIQALNQQLAAAAATSANHSHARSHVSAGQAVAMQTQAQAQAQAAQARQIAAQNAMSQQATIQALKHRSSLANVTAAASLAAAHANGRYPMEYSGLPAAAMVGLNGSKGAGSPVVVGPGGAVAGMSGMTASMAQEILNANMAAGMSPGSAGGQRPSKRMKVGSSNSTPTRTTPGLMNGQGNSMVGATVPAAAVVAGGPNGASLGVRGTSPAIRATPGTNSGPGGGSSNSIVVGEYAKKEGERHSSAGGVGLGPNGGALSRNGVHHPHHHGGAHGHGPGNGFSGPGADRKHKNHDENKPEDDEEEEENNDSALYCFCQQVSYGDMVACDNPDCRYEWFHYGCVGLKAPPSGVWYCSQQCQEKVQSKKSRK
ncbi:inhibitor of growth proteins N-terminal histone-binding-domain-containing protein [Lipomyces oligophaga]|uniref:inhibitor of growth proteins N-terminal histone-binding-domain-containing protein n=1 Tax=Lipomyces oligophaga TaxID=45792 RepID=UPI0034CEE3D7